MTPEALIILIVMLMASSRVLCPPFLSFGSDRSRLAASRR